MNKYINILKRLNDKAKNNGDIPVSAIILKDNNNPFDHAEVLVIKKACKRLKTSNLIDCEMIVTLKPCNMCNELIKECRLKKVYYILDNNKVINNTTRYIKIDEESLYFKGELSDFFKNKR